MNWDVSGLNKKRNSFLAALIAVACFAVFVFLLFLFNPRVKNLFFSFSSPLQMQLSRAGKNSSNWLASFANASSLGSENKNLREENKRLLSEISVLKSIQEGNQALTAISAACQENGFTTLMAGITGLGDQDILTINKGSDDGVAEGMPVIDQNNALFGKIYKVYKNFSQVLLISSKNSIINAQVLKSDPEASPVNGVIKGVGDLSVFLDLVPVNSDIYNGEILITSALDQSFPKNLLIGKISDVDKNDQKPFQQAKIDGFFNLQTTENLFVITDYKKGS